MKRIITILLALLLVLSLAACGGGNTANTPAPMEAEANTPAITETPPVEDEIETAPAKDNDNSIELSLDNYQKYFDVSNWCSVDRDSYTYVTKTHYGSDHNIIGTLYKKANLRVEVNAVSANFNYDDVVFVVKVTGKAECYSGDNPLKSEGNKEFEIQCEVICNVAGNGKETQSYTFTGGYAYKLHNLKYEIVSVEGTIRPA